MTEEEADTEDDAFKSTSIREACIFCGQIRKRVGSNTIIPSLCTSLEMMNKTREVVESLDDQGLIEKFNKLSHFFFIIIECVKHYHETL